MKIKLIFCATLLMTSITSFSVLPDDPVKNKKNLKKQARQIESWELSREQKAELLKYYKKTEDSSKCLGESD